LFRYGERIIDFNAEIPDVALGLRMSQQQLHGTQVAGSTVDERRFGASQRVRGEKVRVEANRCNPARNRYSILLMPLLEKPTAAAIPSRSRQWNSVAERRADSPPRPSGHVILADGHRAICSVVRGIPANAQPRPEWHAEEGGS
jgi:hypothetical protein